MIEFNGRKIKKVVQDVRDPEFNFSCLKCCFHPRKTGKGSCNTKDLGVEANCDSDVYMNAAHFEYVEDENGND